MKQARGMRNNNPLNIIKSEKINWQGEVKPSTDPNFAQFAGALVRHRVGYGDGRVWTEWQGTAGTGAVCRTRVDTHPDKEVKRSPLPKREGTLFFYKTY